MVEYEGITRFDANTINSKILFTSSADNQSQKVQNLAGAAPMKVMKFKSVDNSIISYPRTSYKARWDLDPEFCEPMEGAL